MAGDLVDVAVLVTAEKAVTPSWPKEAIGTSVADTGGAHLLPSSGVRSHSGLGASFGGHRKE